MKLHKQLKWLHPYLESVAHIAPLEKITSINLKFYKSKRPPFLGLCTAYDDDSFTILLKMPAEVENKIPLPYWAQEEVLNHLAHELAHLKVWDHTPERLMIEALIYHTFAVTLNRLNYEEQRNKVK